MSTPLELTNEEMEVLVGLAGPIAWRQRDAFLKEVAEALAELPTRGPGGDASDRARDPTGLRGRSASRDRDRRRRAQAFSIGAARGQSGALRSIEPRPASPPARERPRAGRLVGWARR